MKQSGIHARDEAADARRADRLRGGEEEDSRERRDAEVDAMARALLDCCNLQNAATALTALSAAFHHVAHMVLHGPDFGPYPPERVVSACFNEGVKYARFLDDTRTTTVETLTKV